MYKLQVIYTHKNLGFLRLAIKYRMNIVPVYGFGENQIFTTHKAGFGFRRWLARRWVGFPLVTGKWGTLLPNQVEVVHVYGRPIDTGAIADRVAKGQTSAAGADGARHRGGGDGGGVHMDGEGSKLDETVLEAVHAEYRKEMMALFDRHKDELLPPAVAKKGLTIVHLGHDPDPAMESS